MVPHTRGASPSSSPPPPPNLLPTNQAAALFLVFGVRMLHEGLTMSKTDSLDKMAEEIREVEEELSAGGGPGGSIPLDDLEEGKAYRGTPSRPASPRDASGAGAGGGSIADRMQAYLGVVASPVFVQAFVLTFLGEWGDRSQIATIALAAAHVGPLPSFNPLCQRSLSAGAPSLTTRRRPPLPRPRTEPLHHRVRHHHRPRPVHRRRRHRRPLALNQDLGQVQCVPALPSIGLR